MGTDKAFVEVGGVAMVARVASALAAAGCAPVACSSTATPRLLARTALPTVADRGRRRAGRRVVTGLTAIRPTSSSSRRVTSRCGARRGAGRRRRADRRSGLGVAVATTDHPSCH